MLSLFFDAMKLLLFPLYAWNVNRMDNLSPLVRSGGDMKLYAFYLFSSGHSETVEDEYWLVLRYQINDFVHRTSIVAIKFEIDDDFYEIHK